MTSLRRVLLCLTGLGLGFAGAGLGWWYYTSRPDYRWQRGQQALLQGDLESALILADKLEADGYPDHGHALRGEVYLRQNRIPEAIRQLNQIHPQAEDVRLKAGITFGLGFLSLGRLREAEQLFKYVLIRQPDTIDAHRGLAALYFDQGAKGHAVAHVREWLRLAPEDGSGWRFLGVIYSDFGDSNEWAIDAFRRALQCGLREPLALEVRKELAQLLVKQTRYEEALQVVAELPPAEKLTPEVLEVRGEALRGLRDEAGLQEVLQHALEHPRHVGLLRLRGQVHVDRDELKAAAACLEQALAIDRHDIGSLHLLAQTYEALGRGAEAAEQRRRLLQTQADMEVISKLGSDACDKPWDADMRLRLAEACERLDLHKEAAMWRKAASLCLPQSEAAAQPPRGP